MTISANVQKQFFRAASSTSDDLIRIPPTVIMSHNLPLEAPTAPFIKTRRRLNLWTVEEHDRFLRGLEQYPRGPWKSIAAVVGTKTTRQTMTHSQKYRQKIRRVAAGQTIKIHRMPSLTADDDAPEAISSRAHSTDVIDRDGATSMRASDDVSTATLLESLDAPGARLDDWEIDELLAELSQSMHIEPEGYEGNHR